MDQIVEKIAREVMLKLKAESGNRGSSYSPPQTETFARQGTGTKTVILVTANFKVVDQVMKQISAIVPADGRLLVSDYMLGCIDSMGKTPGMEIHSSKTISARDALKDARELTIPSLSLNSMSKAANLVADSFATQVISYALMDGILLTVCDESILDAGRYFPAGIAKKIDQFRRELEILGARFQRCSLQIKPDHKCSTCLAPESCSICDPKGQSSSGDAFPIQQAQAASQPREAATAGSCMKENCPRSYGSCSSSCESAVKQVIKAGAERVEKGSEAKIPSRELAKYIDHTLLKATATASEITKLCDEAKEYTFASVCVNPGHVALAAKLLQGTPVKVCTVVGFPLGATSTFTKVMETRDAIANGATEIDMVINVGSLKAKDYEYVKNDIARVVEAARGYIVKVILETALLTKEEKIKACELSKQAGADFVKTSTGFSTGGATAEDIALMRAVVGPTMGVKASGGIRDTAMTQQMIAAGATRVGASASVSIVKGEVSATKGY